MTDLEGRQLDEALVEAAKLDKAWFTGGGVVKWPHYHASARAITIDLPLPPRALP